MPEAREHNVIVGLMIGLLCLATIVSGSLDIAQDKKRVKMSNNINARMRYNISLSQIVLGCLGLCVIIIIVVLWAREGRFVWSYPDLFTH